MSNTWDIKAAWSQRIFNDHWEKSDMEVIDKVGPFRDGTTTLKTLVTPIPPFL
jgi:hypothetical protein